MPPLPPSTIVIGSGVVGSAVAASLARRGGRVTVVDRAATAGAGTSATTFSWVNANRKTPAAYQALNAAGVTAHHELARRANDGGLPWFHPTGHLEWADDPAHRAELTERVARLRGTGYRARLLAAPAVRDLEPDISVPAGATVAFFDDEGYCHPAALIARLLGEARAAGARLVTGERVTGVGRGRTSPMAEVRVASGEVLRADTVVSCVGRETGDLLAPLGATVPMVAPATGNAAIGFLAETLPAPARLSRVVTTDRLNLRPAGGGRLLIQALDLDATADPTAAPDPDGAIGRELRRRLSALLPPGTAPGLGSLMVGQRALPADGLTVAGRLPDHPWLAVVATHSGVTLAPLLGELLAEELTDDVRSPLLADFRPDRFVGSAAPTPLAAPRSPGQQ